MTDEIDDVLYDWYKWSSSYEPHLSYGSADSTCRDFRISRQWMGYEDLSAQVDYQIIKAVGEAVEPLIFELSMIHRMAIQVAMRNMDAGYQVWQNPRRPERQDADYAEAKELLRPRLAAKGLISVVAIVQC